MKKLIALMLAAAITASLLSCAGSLTDAQTTDKDMATAQTEATTEKLDEWGRTYVEDSVPDSDYGGQTFTVLCRSDDAYKIEFFTEEQTGEVYNDAVYNRNRAIEERINIKLNVLSQDFDNTTITKNVAAGDNFADLIGGMEYLSSQLVTSGCLYDLNTVNYLDFTKPWWNSSFMDEAELGGKLYFAVGDVCRSSVSGAFVLFFNKTLLDQYHSGLNLYEKVFDGSWTLEYFASILKDIYADLNGDNAADKGDLFGLLLGRESSSTDALLYAAGIRYTESDGEGGQNLLLFEDTHNAEVLQTIQKFVYETEGVRTSEGTWWDAYLEMTDEFRAKHGVFHFKRLDEAEALRDFDDEFGILPTPAPEDQSGQYSTFIYDQYTVLMVPITAVDTDLTGKVMELLCAESYRSVTPAYYEYAMNEKYLRDSESVQCFELIRSNIRFEFGVIYTTAIGALTDVARNIIVENQPVASTLAQKQKATTAAFEKFIEKTKG